MQRWSPGLIWNLRRLHWHPPGLIWGLRRLHWHKPGQLWAIRRVWWGWNRSTFGFQWAQWRSPYELSVMITKFGGGTKGHVGPWVLDSLACSAENCPVSVSVSYVRSDVWFDDKVRCGRRLVCLV